MWHMTYNTWHMTCDTWHVRVHKYIQTRGIILARPVVIFCPLHWKSPPKISFIASSTAAWKHDANVTVASVPDSKHLWGVLSTKCFGGSPIRVISRNLRHTVIVFSLALLFLVNVHFLGCNGDFNGKWSFKKILKKHFLMVLLPTWNNLLIVMWQKYLLKSGLTLWFLLPKFLFWHTQNCW